MEDSKAIEVQVETFDAGSHVMAYDKEGRSTRFAKKKSLSDIFTIICAGAALLSDGYQNNCMNMLNSVFALKYPETYDSTMKTRVSNALLVGAVLGQVVVGVTGDYFGRKWAILTTTLMIVVGTILATASHGVTTEGMFWMMIVARGITGFGVGGEYPASSTAASESANEATKKRGGVFVLVTNLPLSLGGPFALIVFLIVYPATGSGAHLSTTWRVMLGIGCIWPLAVFYFRFKMATSVLYKKGAIKKNVPYWLTFKYYWRRLLGTCGCWFIYDFVTFPNGIFSSTIISSVLDDTSDLEKVAEWNLLLAIISIPMLFVGAFLTDRIGRKYTMCIGFAGYLVIGLIIGCSYKKITKIVPLFIIFYGIFNGFGNLGPGNILGLTSAESYATPVRSTLYGLSAALGKTGAAVGTQAFTPIQNNLGKQWTFIIAALLGFTGVVLAFLCIPHGLEDDLMLEDVRYFSYLRRQGWTGDFGSEGEIDSYEKKPSGLGDNAIIERTETLSESS
ncbi:hypothetical protein KL918_001748 [Ogataea parapolymorpha]|uniref:Metabolite transport protein GIT1 n=1 Tax=Ogataea parapolymorpha (strain ATCC 26012 / BCRC 20466 / JCM 22074 / NRRL Y-7560 / DL-1) TaxID=871575 RepID=W1QCW7_OGAPD|nr:metabolite transport protein GIT1 [Ogataea parapolymorpha DL-1]ESW98862.1 metabolite transport protein GIT1 [Ogataea parapolymorpha DL-1]KAG7868090.1 hypothetical protein KL918_001748 [Ogataea parapolymorpha]KAG7874290.1 hypothetical protein KL916_001630 [Ogataea parapolymorpha]